MLLGKSPKYLGKIKQLLVKKIKQFLVLPGTFKYVHSYSLGGYIVIGSLMTGTSSEKRVIRQFCCVDIVEYTCTNADS